MKPAAFLIASLLAFGGCSSSSHSASVDAGADGTHIDWPDPFTLTPFDGTRITSDSSQPNFQHADAPTDWGAGPFASVKLVVDLGTTCFPFDNWKSDPPPDGQNWPADCDAFDRNFEFSLDDPEDASAGPPGLELVRAITPFGGPMHVEVDLTDVANGLPGPHTLRVTIPTWSDGAGQVSGSNGGWNVSAKIDVVPGPPPRRVLAVVPLYYGDQTTDTAPDPIHFAAPPATSRGRVEYRVTGHGGGKVDKDCIGPAEEFCDRTHAVYIDGRKFAEIEPWRDDCDQLCTVAHQGPASGGFDYCMENPCGAMQSVRAPRANWCPGSVTPPFTWASDDEPALAAPGDHTFGWDIDRVAAGGLWHVSATYFAYGD